MVQSLSASPEQTLARLSQLLKTLREAGQTEEMIEAIAPYLQHELGYCFAWLGLDESGEGSLLGHEVFSPLKRSLMHRERIALEAGSLLEKVFVERRPLCLPDLGEAQAAGKWQMIARTLGIQGTLLFPIHCRDRCYGIALLAQQTWGMSPNTADIAVLSLIFGQIATTLHQRQESQVQARKKQPATPLLRLLDELRQLPSLDSRLQRLVDETHLFVGASRTALYWFEPDKRYFWRRCANHTHSHDAGNSKRLELAVADCPGLYQTLNSDRPLSVSDTNSALQAEISSYLQSQLKVRSLFVAPICTPEGLLGFLSAEGLAPRLWSAEEKQYLQGAAQLAALIAPLGDIEQEIAQGKADQLLVTDLGQSIRSERSWHEGLRDTAQQLFGRLGIERLLLLDYNEDQRQFTPLLQYQHGKRKPLVGPLPLLSELDAQLLADQRQGVAIEDWQDDLRLMAWKAPLESMGVRSVWVCPTAPQGGSEAHWEHEGLRDGILLVTRDQPYAWPASERSLLTTIAQQLHLVMHQRTLERQTTQLSSLHRSLQWGLTALHQEHDPDRLDEIGTQAIAHLFEVPLVALIAWSPQDGLGRLAASCTADSQWTLPPELTLESFRDPLVQALLQSGESLVVPRESFSEATQTWLSLPLLDQVVLFPLRSSSRQVPLGIVVLGTEKRRHWSEQILALGGILVAQLSNSRQSVRRLAQLQAHQGQLQQLNWYKQYCGEHFQSSLQRGVQRLQADISRSNPVLQSLETLLGQMEAVFGQERWSLKTNNQTLNLTRFFKQVKERIDPQVYQQQLWCQFHSNEAQHIQLHGDILKLEGIVHSLLVAACDRCFIGDRIDVWCRPQPNHSIEITVTDNGIMDPQLLMALQPTANPEDPLVQAMLEAGPGLVLSLVQRLTERLGGQLEFLDLEDGRIMSRLLLHQPPSP